MNNEQGYSWNGNDLLLRIHLQPPRAHRSTAQQPDPRQNQCSARGRQSLTLIAKRLGVPKNSGEIETRTKSRTKLLRFSGVKTRLNARSIREFLEQNK